jgi:DNA-binding response OmpR family regulator
MGTAHGPCMHARSRYSRYERINRVRGYEFEGYERTIDSHFKNLRRRIEADPPSSR